MEFEKPLQYILPGETLRRPRVLILALRHGGAHMRMAHALRQALIAIEPALEVEIVDALARSATWFRLYYDSYILPLKYWPSLWSWIEKHQHQGQSTGPAFLYRRGAQPLFSFIEAWNPDVVITTEVGLCEIAAMLKRERGLRFYLVGLNGIDVERAWAQPELDLFLITPEIAWRLEEAGVDPSKILRCGMPIDPAFSALPDRVTARRTLGLNSERPVLLVLFGGAGFGKPQRTLPELAKIGAMLDIVFIAGRNSKLRRELESIARALPQAKVLGWVDNMHEWLAAADIVLNKPSGVAIMEAIAAGAPFLAIDPLPGNERRHCDLIEKWGIGKYVRRHEDLAMFIQNLLRNPQELHRMRECERAMARPSAAHDAAQAILSRSRAEIRN
jgi:processive 1,2-diacylglycerol beta-glucosyltransferase